MKSKTVNLIQLNLAVLIWGGTAMFAKGIPLPVGHIICIRSLVGAGALFIFLLGAGLPMKIKRPGHYGVMALLGILMGLHWLTYFQALKDSTAAVAILSLHTYPVFTAIVEPFVFREKLRKTDIALAVVVFTGILIMTPEISLSNSTTRAILMGILSGLLFMGRNLLTRKYVQEYSSSFLMFCQMFIIGVLLLPVLFITAKVEYSSQTIGLLVLLGIAFTAIPHTLYSASFKTLSAKTVGILATLLPFYGAVFGYLIHKEMVTVRTAIGGMLILFCIIFETLKSIKVKNSDKKTPKGHASTID
jgi:drug/metabolite transporter (DMT)-like permease